MKYKIEREIPVIGEYDVVVVGGGMAGFGAACAASRNGAKTLLIENSAQLGGMATLGGVANFCYNGPLEGQGRVFEDVLDLLKKMKAMGSENGWKVIRNYTYDSDDHTLDSSILSLVLQHIAETSGVEILYHSDAVDVIKDGNSISAVIIHNKSLLQAINAKVIIDGTGDGIVAQHAGAEVLDNNDPNHPEQMPASLMVFLRNVGLKQIQGVIDESYIDLKNLPRHSYWEEPDGRIVFKSFVRGFDLGTGKGLSDAERLTRRMVPNMVNFFQEKYLSTYKLDYISPALGVREGRRIKGDYILTIDDILSKRRFDDCIAYGTFTIDTVNKREKVPPYQIPLRSLFVQNVENMFVVGRCLSADRLAMSSARVMATCCMMGQAAGIGAALACKDNVSIRQVLPGKVRNLLISDSMNKEVMVGRISPV